MAKKENHCSKLVDILASDKTCYHIPTLQRNYEWETREVEELWSDLFDVDHWDAPNATSPHFMGTLVMCERNESGEDDETEDSLDVLDGQQRLTTMSLLLMEAYQRIVKLKQEGYDYENLGSAKLSVRFKDAKGDLRSRLVLQKSPDKAIYEHILGNLPERADVSREHLRKLFQSQFKHAKLGRNKLLLAHIRIRDLFDKEIERAVAEGYTAAEALDLIAGRILSGTEFLWITAKSSSSAFKIFESLNDRGVELSQADLLKNKFCSRLTDHEIKRFGDQWMTIRDAVGAEPKGLVSYLRSYAIVIKGKVAQSELVDFYDLELGVKKGQKTDKKKVAKAVMSLMANLVKNSTHYANLTSTSELEAPEGVADWVGKVSFLNNIQAKSCRHALLAALMLNYSQLDKLLDLIVSLQFRSSICDSNPNKIEVAHCNVARLIYDSNGSVNIDKIASVYEPLIPGNEQFLEKFIQQEAKSIPVWRQFLEFYHMHAHGSELKIGGTDSVHVEHVLAQKASPAARAESKISTDEALAKAVYMPGNLTLLDRKKNIKAANKPFTIKLKQYYKGTIIPMNKYFYEGIERWTAAEIERRTVIMCVAASEMWPHPVEGAMSEAQSKAFLASFKKKQALDDSISG